MTFSCEILFCTIKMELMSWYLTVAVSCLFIRITPETICQESLSGFLHYGKHGFTFKSIKDKVYHFRLFDWKRHMCTNTHIMISKTCLSRHKFQMQNIVSFCVWKKRNIYNISCFYLYFCSLSIKFWNCLDGIV